MRYALRFAGIELAGLMLTIMAAAAIAGGSSPVAVLIGLIGGSITTLVAFATV